MQLEDQYLEDVTKRDISFIKSNFSVSSGTNSQPSPSSQFSTKLQGKKFICTFWINTIYPLQTYQVQYYSSKDSYLINA